MSLLLLALVAVPAGAGAAGREDAATRRAERQALDLYNRAAQRVVARSEGCGFQPDDTPPQVVDGEPSEALKSVLGILRRPATEAERARLDDADTRVAFFPGTDGLYRSGTREATSASGTRFVILTAARVTRTGPTPEVFDRCQAAIRREAERRLRGRSARVARFVRRIVREARRQRPEPAPATPPEGLFMQVLEGSGFGATGGAFDPRRFTRQGEFLSSGGAGPRAKLSGLVPDGVASVTVEYPRRASRGPGRKPKVYPGPFTRTEPVQDNVVSLDVPRAAPDAFPPRMLWRGPGGELVRVVR